MRGMEAILQFAEKQLGVRFGTICKQIVTTRPTSQIASWLLPPSQWSLLQMDTLEREKLKGELKPAAKAVVIGCDGGGNMYLLATNGGDDHTVGEEVLFLDHELGEVTIFGESLEEPDREKALLKQANRILGSKREIVDEEDTFE